MEQAEYALMDEAEGRMWWYRALHARLIDALAPVRGLVCDAGCGTGGFLARLSLARPDLDLIGCEYDEGAIARARTKSPASFVRGSINALPFADASLDGLVTADVLCHAAVDPAAALAEIRRVLRPGGVMVANMPSYQWLASAHDLRVANARRTTRTAFRAQILTAGLIPHRVFYWNSLLLPLMVAQRKILARRHDSASDVAIFPPWLDLTLHGITQVERALPKLMPAGGSILAIATRP